MTKKNKNSLPLKEYQVDKGSRGVYDRRNTLNDLTGREWLFSTKTVIPKDYTHKSLSYPVDKSLPVNLIADFIRTFTKNNETVLDPFAGNGATLLAINKSFMEITGNNNTNNRRGIGIFQDSSHRERYHSLIPSHKNNNIQTLAYDNNQEVYHFYNEPSTSIDFIFTDLEVYISDLLTFDKNYNQLFPNIPDILKIIFERFSLAANKLKMYRYAVVSIPAIFSLKHSSFNSNSTINPLSINFALSNYLVDLLSQIPLVLKAERLWFSKKDLSTEDDFFPLKRRFLVFRKEEEVSNQPLMFPQPLIINKLVGSSVVHPKTYPPSYNHKLRSLHGGMKPPELASLLISKFSSNKNDLVLDPFAGVGGTLLGASLTKRKAIGIDINSKWFDIYRQVSQEFNLPIQVFHIGDARDIIPDKITDDSIDLVLTDVPYWAMDKLKKTRGRFSRAGEPSKEKLKSSLKKFNDSSIETLPEWITLMKEVFSLCYSKLKNDKRLVVFIGNMYRTIKEGKPKQQRVGRYLMLTGQLASALVDIGYHFDKEIIWYAPDKSLHIFGYPFSYIPSVVHQSILVFRK